MTRLNSSHLRRTLICAATAIAVSLPGIATAGLLSKAKSRAQSAKANTATVLSIVHKKGQAVSAVQGTVQGAAQDLPTPAELFQMLRELDLPNQLRGTMELARQMNADYAKFSPDKFRNEVKAVLDDYLWLAQSVPGLQDRTGLLDNISRASNLIDYVPPRVLYMMSQALGDQLAGLSTAAENMRTALDMLPPFISPADAWTYARTGAGAVADSRVCKWVALKDKPFVAWFKAEVTAIAWALKTAEGLIPNPEIKVEGGGTAGVAVANAAGAAGTTVKPLDPLHNALKVAAVIPEAINMAIDLNMARATMLCAAGKLASN
jgi:hypothetical protein